MDLEIQITECSEMWMIIRELLVITSRELDTGIILIEMCSIERGNTVD